MGNGKSIVITAYGHKRTIDKIAVSLFDGSCDCYHYNNESNAKTYCDAINNFELKEESWVFARIVSENVQYSLDAFLPLTFNKTIKALDDRAIQKVLREAGTQEIAVALKGEDEATVEKIFNNMSNRAVKMLKDDMVYMGPVRLCDVKRSQERIVNIIRRLEETGEIVIPYSKGETIE
jgi:flagellar motor switch protein FliG